MNSSHPPRLLTARSLWLLLGFLCSLSMKPVHVRAQVRVYAGPVEQRDTTKGWAWEMGPAIANLSCTNCQESGQGFGARFALLRGLMPRVYAEAALDVSTAQVADFAGKPILFSVGLRSHLPEPWGGYAIARAGGGWVERWDGDWSWVSSWGGTVAFGWEFKASEKVDLGGYVGFIGFGGENSVVTSRTFGVTAVVGF